MIRKRLFQKAKGLLSDALSIGLFGVNSFILLLWINQHNSSLVYVICCVTVAYAFVLIGIHISEHSLPSTKTALFARVHLTFRWLYVAVYLTIILFNMSQIGHGSIDLSNGKLVFQWVMFVVIALTIPRDILTRKAISWAKQKWEKRKGFTRNEKKEKSGYSDAADNNTRRVA